MVMGLNKTSAAAEIGNYNIARDKNKLCLEL